MTNKKTEKDCPYCDIKLPLPKEVVIDNSPYGQLKSLLGAMNLDVAKPWLDEAILQARLSERTALVREIEKMKLIDVTKDGLQIGDASAYNHALDDIINLITNKK